MDELEYRQALVDLSRDFRYLEAILIQARQMTVTR